MAKGHDTRGAIIDAALDQAIDLGLDGITIGGLSDRLGMSKSGLFAHFGSKAELQLGVLEDAIDRFRRIVIAPSLAQTDPVDRLRILFGAYLDWLAGEGEVKGCLFASMAQTFADRPGPLRERLEQAQVDWRAFLADQIRSVAIRPADADQFVFEFVGAALSFQHEHRLMRSPTARGRAERAFEAALSRAAAHVPVQRGPTWNA